MVMVGSAPLLSSDGAESSYSGGPGDFPCVALSQEATVPRLVYDRTKQRIHIVGGAYKVKPEGIVN